MQYPILKGCFALLCGVPASGKSSLAAQMHKHAVSVLQGQLHLLLLQYDTLLPAEVQSSLVAQGKSQWKVMRSQILECVTSLLTSLAQPDFFKTNRQVTSEELVSEQDFKASYIRMMKPDNVNSDLWERFKCAVQNSLHTVNSQRNQEITRPWIILVDDNMHYCSMRYEYCQLARKFKLGLCIIYIDCPLEVALERNTIRSEGRVEEYVINNMHKRLEPPDAVKRPWEKYSLTLNKGISLDLESIFYLITMAIDNPQQESHEENLEAIAASRLVSFTNTTHQVDQILRKCIALHMSKAKVSGLNKVNLGLLASNLADCRKAILHEIRKGEIPLSLESDIFYVSHSTQESDENCRLVKFVEKLLISRFNACQNSDQFNLQNE